jgi:hypothetical protein
MTSQSSQSEYNQANVFNAELQIDDSDSSLHLTDKSVDHSSISRHKKDLKRKKSLSSDSDEIVWSLVPFDNAYDNSNGASRIEDKNSPSLSL